MRDKLYFLILLLILTNSIICQNSNNLGRDKNLYYYFNFGYENTNSQEFKKIKNDIVKKYDYFSDSTQTGYITIRFFVDTFGYISNISNLQVDNSFNRKTFHNITIKKLTDIIASIRGWKVCKQKNKAVEYLMFITIKLHNGKIIDIYP